MPIRGSIDRIDELAIEGWAIDDDHVTSKLAFDVLVNDRMIGRFIADGFRQDLKDAEIGDGECAFSFQMPQFFGKQDLPNLRIRFADSNLFLALPAVPAQREMVPATASRFGGLWLDRADWLDRLGQKHRAGQLSDGMAARLFQFARDGYTVFEKAVAPRLLERMKGEIDQIWQRPPEGLLIETFEPDGVMRYVPPDARLRRGRTKMLDAFGYSELARQVIAAPPVLDFLGALFDDTPKAFQSLNLNTGTAQAMHKDTAYVKVDGNPLALAASWTALEDVEAGNGELEYLIGSHRAPDFLFGGMSKWMENFSDENQAFLDSIQADAERLGHKRGRFLARRGDVLVWHADLAHADSPALPDRTRQALLTHFCPGGFEPYYRRNAMHPTLTENGCIFVSQYGPVKALA